MKVAVDRKAFEFNWSEVESRRVIYIREIRYKVTHEAAISKNAAEWLAKKLMDAADFWCRGQKPEGRPRWEDSLCTLELKFDYNNMGHFIKAEIWSSSDNRTVYMYFPIDSSCRGWREVGETLFTFISGHNANKEGQGDLNLETLAMQAGASGVKADENNTRGLGRSKSLVGETELEMSLKRTQKGAKKLVLDTPSSVAEWKEALVFTLSDDCKGWGWLMEAVKDEFSLTLEPKIKPFSAIKAVVQITDKLVRRRMLNLGMFEVRGISVIISAWDPSANTLSEDWLNRKKRWMNILGLPFHLWTEDNITAIGEMLGKVIDIHEDTLSLKKLECAKVLIEVDGSQMNNNEFELYEGGLNYKLNIFPEMTPNDIGKPWKVLHALQKDGRHGVDKDDVSPGDERPTLGIDGVSIPAAVNETDPLPCTSKTAGVLIQLDESRNRTTPINETGQKHIKTYQRTKVRRNDGKTRNIIFPSLVKQTQEGVTLQ